MKTWSTMIETVTVKVVGAIRVIRATRAIGAVGVVGVIGKGACRNDDAVVVTVGCNTFQRSAGCNSSVYSTTVLVIAEGWCHAVVSPSNRYVPWDDGQERERERQMGF